MVAEPDIYTVVMVNQATRVPRLLSKVYDTELDALDASEALTNAAVMHGWDQLYYAARVVELKAVAG